MNDDVTYFENEMNKEEVLSISKIRLSIINLGIIFGLMLCLSGCSEPASVTTAAKDGALDLRERDLSEQSVMLQGEWEFYWKVFLTPAEFGQEHPLKTKHLIALPHSWNGYVWEGQHLTGDGYATFRLMLHIREQDMEKNLVLRIPTIFHSYKLWINGKLYTEVGQVGTDRSNTVPSLATKQIYFQPEKDQVELVMQVANFHHLRGGITKYIELGDSDAMTTSTNLKIAFEMFVTASLLIIGAYHLMLYMQRRKDKAMLYFGLFSIIWAIRSLLVGELILTKWFPSFPWGVQIKIEYLALYSGTYIFTMYFYHLFKEVPSWFQIASRWLATIFCLIVVVAPARIYTHTLLAYEVIIVVHLIYFLYALCKATMQKKEGAAIFLTVSVITFASVINDFLYYNEKLLLGNSSTWGLLIFTFAQMYLLSTRFAKAAENEEKAALELAAANDNLFHVNQNLERIVLERTNELSASNESLRQAYDQLLRSEEGRKKLLSYITHDLKAPLSTMLGYVEAVQDNVKPEKSQTYLKFVYDKTVWLNRMIEDLSFLSHLETSQISFAMRAVPMQSFIREFWQQYEWVIKDAELNGKLTISLPPDHEDTSLHVYADPLRYEQALSNVMTNALKFTPRRGMIALSLSFWEIDGAKYAVIEMKNTGSGIQPEHLERIFERNYKHYPSGFEQTSMGSGLGLAIAKEIVEAHEGKIWAESTGKAESSFFIALPVMTNEMEQGG